MLFFCIFPSFPRASQRSHTVVAPSFTGNSQPGYSSFKKISYAISSVDLAEDEDKQETVYLVNADGTRNIAGVCRELGCKIDRKSVV